MIAWTAEHPKLGRLNFTGRRKAEVVAEVKKLLRDRCGGTVGE